MVPTQTKALSFPSLPDLPLALVKTRKCKCDTDKRKIRT